MPNLSRVVWCEGMHLGSLQFQLQNRYFEDSLHFATNQVWFEPYGFLGYELDAEALTNGTLALVHARGVFPDGLPFHIPEHDATPPPRQISGLFPPMSDSMEVSLALPAFNPDGANCTLNGESSNTRFIADSASFVDENTGRDSKPVSMGRKNIRFLLSTEPQDGLVTLPIARIRRDHSGAIVYDEQMIPAVLQISGSKRLMRVVRRLLDLLGEKCRALPKPRDIGVATASGFSADGIANAWFLHCMQSSLGPLLHLYSAKRAHPEELYRELSRLAGALCTFGLESDASSLPLYNHLALAECFDALDRHIVAHLEMVTPSNRAILALERAAQFFYAGSITDQRVVHRSRWILGIHSEIGEAELIDTAPRLIKVCSREFLPRLVERALPGLKLTHLPVPPPAISPKVHFQYFSIDKVGPCWEHIVKTREYSLYVPGELPEPELELAAILES